MFNLNRLLLSGEKKKIHGEGPYILNIASWMHRAEDDWDTSYSEAGFDSNLRKGSISPNTFNNFSISRFVDTSGNKNELIFGNYQNIGISNIYCLLVKDPNGNKTNEQLKLSYKDGIFSYYKDTGLSSGWSWDYGDANKTIEFYMDTEPYT